jgi:hypothetical protein
VKRRNGEGFGVGGDITWKLEKENWMRKLYSYAILKATRRFVNSKGRKINSTICFFPFSISYKGIKMAVVLVKAKTSTSISNFDYEKENNWTIL